MSKISFKFPRGQWANSSQIISKFLTKSEIRPKLLSQKQRFTPVYFHDLYYNVAWAIIGITTFQLQFKVVEKFWITRFNERYINTWITNKIDTYLFFGKIFILKTSQDHKIYVEGRNDWLRSIVLALNSLPGYECKIFIALSCSGRVRCFLYVLNLKGWCKLQSANFKSVSRIGIWLIVRRLHNMGSEFTGGTHLIPHTSGGCQAWGWALGSLIALRVWPAVGRHRCRVIGQSRWLGVPRAPTGVGSQEVLRGHHAAGPHGLRSRNTCLVSTIMFFIP